MSLQTSRLGLIGMAALGFIAGAGPGLVSAQAPAPDQEQETKVPTATPGPEDADGVVQLETISVSATRTDRAVSTVPGTVSVKTQAQIQGQNASGLKSLLDDEVGVTVPKAQGRFGTGGGTSTGRAGTEGVNIRGLDGNRVLMTQDGVRLPGAFNFGPPIAMGRGDFTETEALKSVEVLRGPVSAQYGSDGLAGALIQRTLEAEDLVRTGQSVGGLARLSYSSAERLGLGTAALAAKREAWQGLLLGTVRRGHETANRGSVDAAHELRTKPDPADVKQRYALVKVALTPSAVHYVGLGLEYLRRGLDTEVLSARTSSVPPRPGATLDLQTQDTVARDRFSVDYRYTDAQAAAVQKAQLRAYWQDAEVRQKSQEDQYQSPRRLRDNSYQTTVQGLSAQLESNFIHPVMQRLTYGLDIQRSFVRGMRDGAVPPRGESFPSKPFPDTVFTQSGAFVQSEIELGAFSLIPGLRFDRYTLRPSKDGYPPEITQLSGQAFSPRLGALWHVNEAFTPYVQWSQGFKAPQPDEVNTYFENRGRGYSSIANPALKPERAKSLELGLRGKVADIRYGLAWFDNRYRDFISQEVVANRPLQVYQYVNLAQVRIHGVEATLQWQITPRWLLHTALSTAQGSSEKKAQRYPLDSVNPLKVAAGLRYDTQQFGVYTQLVYQAAKRASAANTISGRDNKGNALEFAPFLAPASTVVDLGGYWKPHKDWTIQMRVGNLFNKRYWRWSDVRGITADSPVIDAYSAPGRQLRLSVTYQF